MKKILLALAAVSTLAAAVPASAEYLHVKSTAFYTGGIGLPNDGSIPYEKGEWVKVSVGNTWGHYNSHKVKPNDTVAYSAYYHPMFTAGDVDPWYEYKIPAGYDLHVTFAGTLFNPTLDVKIAPTTDTDSPYYVNPNPTTEPVKPVEKYVKPTPTGEQWLEWLDELRNANTDNLTVIGH